MTDDWLKFLRYYVTRDLAFIIGGMSLLLCFNYSWPNTKSNIFGSNISVPEYLFIAGVAYVLGYLVQDLSCVVFGKLITTSTKKIIPGKWLKMSYERYTQSQVDWEKIPDYDEDDATIYINLERSEKNKAEYERRSERNQAEFERMIAHLIMCMTIGPCWLIVGVFLFLRCLTDLNWYGIFLGLLIFIFGVCLVFLGKLKSLRIQKFRHDLVKALKEVKGSLQQSQRSLKESQQSNHKETEKS